MTALYCMVRTIRNFSPQNGAPRRSLSFRIERGTRVLGEINNNGFGSAAVQAVVLGMMVCSENDLLHDALCTVHQAMLYGQVMNEYHASSLSEFAIEREAVKLFLVHFPAFFLVHPV